MKAKVKKFLTYFFFKANQVLDVLTNVLALALKVVNIIPTGKKATVFLEDAAKILETTGKYVDDFEELKDVIVEVIPEEETTQKL